MANINKLRRPAVTIDIGDGIERTMKYTLNAFALLEEKYGSMDLAMEAMESGSFMAIRYILWAGLVHEDENLTEHYVGGTIEIADLETISERMNLAMTGDLPDKEEDSKQAVVTPVPNN